MYLQLFFWIFEVEGEIFLNRQMEAYLKKFKLLMFVNTLSNVVALN